MGIHVKDSQRAALELSVDTGLCAFSHSPPPVGGVFLIADFLRLSGPALVSVEFFCGKESIQRK
jgi:hypothetical protein